MEKLEKLLNAEDVAEMLGVTRSAIYAWTWQKKIPHIKLSRNCLKFREKDIMDWISQKSVSPEAPEARKKTRHYGRPSFSLSDDSIERIIRNAKNEVLKDDF